MSVKVDLQSAESMVVAAHVEDHDRDVIFIVPAHAVDARIKEVRTLLKLRGLVVKTVYLYNYFQALVVTSKTWEAAIVVVYFETPHCSPTRDRYRDIPLIIIDDACYTSPVGRSDYYIEEWAEEADRRSGN